MSNLGTNNETPPITLVLPIVGFDIGAISSGNYPSGAGLYSGAWPLAY